MSRTIQPNGSSSTAKQRARETSTDAPSSVGPLSATTTLRLDQSSVTGLTPPGGRPNSSPADTPSGGSDKSSTPMTNGPMNSNYVIPPRAKPGRKPATEFPDSKRKAQNRAAQRAFRQRKQDLQQEAEAEVKTLRDQLQTIEQNASYQQQRADAAEQALAANQQQLARMEADLRRLNEQLMAQDTEVNRLRSMVHPVDASRILPHSLDAPQPIQTEFRSQIFASQPRGHAAPDTPPTDRPLDAGCGNCDKAGNCPCVDDFVDTAGSRPLTTPIQSTSSRGMSVGELCSPTSQALAQVLETDFTSFRPTAGPVSSSNPGVSRAEFPASLLTGPIRFSDSSDASAPSSMRPPPRILKAGTCAACQKDPEQKRMCEELASSRPFASLNPNGTRRFSAVDPSAAFGQDADAPPAKRQVLDCPQATSLLRLSRQESTSSELSNLTAILGDIVQWPENERAPGYGVEVMEGADTLLKMRASFDFTTSGASTSLDRLLKMDR